MIEPRTIASIRRKLALEICNVIALDPVFWSMRPWPLALLNGGKIPYGVTEVSRRYELVCAEFGLTGAECRDHFFLRDDE